MEVRSIMCGRNILNETCSKRKRFGGRIAKYDCSRASENTVYDHDHCR